MRYRLEPCLTFVFLFVAIVAGMAQQPINIQIRYGSRLYDLTPDTRGATTNGGRVKYACTGLPSLKIYVNTTVKELAHHKVVMHKLGILSAEKLKEDLTVFFPAHSIQTQKAFWYPLKNGIGNEVVDATKMSAAYKCAGRAVKMDHDLAVPLVVGSLQANTVALMTDPFFSSMFDNGRIFWIYPKEVGLEDSVERRTIVEAYDVTSPDDAMNIFYTTVLNDVPPGPAWIKDIAMISYDYMSDDGQGWFNDIDSLSNVISKPDRNKVLLTLHGWYDYLGRYSFNQKSGKLDKQWKSPLKKAAITLADLHQRIQYAKDRGFKVAMYFADGVVSSDSLDDYAPDKALPGATWNGPDVLGKSYVRNIAVDEYYDFYLNYAAALFKEFGKQADMFVWDETYYMRAGQTGTDKYRAYLDRKFMRLVKEITARLHQVNPDAAFMASDLIGPDHTGYGGAGHDSYSDVPPYALVADGDYQDSNCQPMFWSYGIFPNYRNVVWSCNWTPVTRFDLTLFGVLQYQSPVVFTNGWGDNVGYSEMLPNDKINLIKLFNYRKHFKTQLQWMKALPLFIPLCIAPNK